MGMMAIIAKYDIDHFFQWPIMLVNERIFLPSIYRRNQLLLLIL